MSGAVPAPRSPAQCMPVSAAFVGRRALMGGMSTNRGPDRVVPGSLVRPPFAGGWNGVPGGTWTGSMAHCWALRQQARVLLAPSAVPVARGRGRRICVSVCPAHGLGPQKSLPPVCPAGRRRCPVGATGLLFGNCIVDASIL